MNALKLTLGELERFHAMSETCKRAWILPEKGAVVKLKWFDSVPVECF